MSTGQNPPAVHQLALFSAEYPQLWIEVLQSLSKPQRTADEASSRYMAVFALSAVWMSACGLPLLWSVAFSIIASLPVASRWQQRRLDIARAYAVSIEQGLHPEMRPLFARMLRQAVAAKTTVRLLQLEVAAQRRYIKESGQSPSWAGAA